MRRVGRGALCLALLFLIGVSPLAAHAQLSNESRIVKSIVVEGCVHTDPSEVLSVVQLKVGDDLSRLAVRRQITHDLKAIAELGYFDEFGVSVAEEPVQGGVRVVFLVNERPLIRDIEVEGNDVYIKSDKRLKKEMGYARGDRVFYSVAYADELETKLRDFYKKKGFPLINEEDVTYRTRPIGDNEVILVFSVIEGKKRKITGVYFRDPDKPGQPLYFTDKYLHKRIKSKKSWWFISRRYEDTKVQQDLDIIERLYRSEGFLDVVVARGDLEADPEKPKGIHLVYDIQEGPQYRVSNITVEGNSLFSNEEIQQVLTAVPGEPLDEIKFRYTDDIPAVRDLYYGQGFVNVRVGVDYEKDPVEETVDLIISIREGNRVYLSDIDIRGVVFDPDTGEKLQDAPIEELAKEEFKTKRFLIEREIDIKRGQLLDWGDVKAAERRLNSLGYFERFDRYKDTGFSVSPTEDPSKMNLVLRAEERMTGQIGFGGGWSSVFGFSAFVGLREENFFGRGQIFDINVEFGERRQNYRLQFSEPHFLGTDYLLGFDLYNQIYKSLGSREFQEERLGAAVKVGKRLNRDWSASLGLRGESVDISDIDSADILELPQIYEDARGKHTTFSVTGALTYDTLDYRPRPRRGNYDVLSLQVADFGGDNEFVKLAGEANYYHPFPWWDKLVFAARQEVGYAFGFGNTENVPLQERFFEGGVNSIRGFQTYSLGPKDYIYRTYYERNARGEIVKDIESGEPIIDRVSTDEVNLGGEFKSVTNLELRYRVIDMIELAYFVDAGYAWDSVSDFAFEDFRVSTGVSLQVDLPLGFPVRFDLGVPIVSESGDDTEFITFSFYRQFR